MEGNSQKELIAAAWSTSQQLLEDALGLSPSLTAPVTSQSEDFHVRPLGIEARLAEQQCTEDAEAQAEREIHVRLETEAPSLKQSAATRWSELEPQITSCAEVEDAIFRQTCAEEVSAFYTWSSGLRVVSSPGTVEIELSCGRREVAVRSASVEADVEALLVDIEQSFEGLGVAGLTLRRTGTSTARGDPFSVPDLGVQQFLTEQACTRVAAIRAQEELDWDLQKTSNEREQQAASGWSELEPQLQQCTVLAEEERRPCIYEVEKYLLWLSALHIERSPGMVTVDTDYGPRDVAVEATTATVDIREWEARARSMLRALENKDEGEVDSESPAAGLLGSWDELGDDADVTDTNLNGLECPIGLTLGTTGDQEEIFGFADRTHSTDQGLDGGVGTGTRGRGTGLSSYGEGGGGTGKKRKASVKMGQFVILGALDQALINKVIKQNEAKFLYCYQRELVKQPDLEGKMTLNFDISGDGSVAKSSTYKTTLKNSAAESCMNSQMKRLRFPEPKGGGIVIVKYSFVFTPSD